MKSASSFRPFAAAFLACLVASTAAGADDTPPGECPEILSASEVETGQVGTGWTVIQGKTPQPFAVTILGIQTNGIAPGHDLAIIDIADKAGSHFVADAGGIWAGMSGSPVYIDGKLAGAVSYTFSRGPSTIGGMTLAEDMMELLSFGEPADDEPVVSLSDASRTAVAAHLDASLDSVDTTFSRLRTPIVASGIASSALETLQTALDEQGFHGFLVPGSSIAAPAAEQTFSKPVPGGNFAAVVSYGDVSVGGVGTTSYVCGDQALAFGHSLALRGETTFGANDATAFAIVGDPALGPFKLASIDSPFGVTDQDRIAAIRGTLGVSPDLIPVTARLRSLDLDRTRAGATWITMPEYVRSIATSHLIDDIMTVTDSTSGGSAVVRWKIRGTRGNGEPWEVRLTDRLTSPTDIGITAGLELLNDLARIDENEFESVTFGGVAITGRISSVARQDRIVSVEVSKNGGEFDEVDSLTVSPGDILAFRVALRKPNGGVRYLDPGLIVPQDAKGSGRVVIAGGREFSSFDCFSFPDTCPRTFPALLEAMAAVPRSDDVVVDLSFFSNFSKHYKAAARHRAVVVGRVSMDVTVVGNAAATSR